MRARVDESPPSAPLGRGEACYAVGWLFGNGREFKLLVHHDHGHRDDVTVVVPICVLGRLWSFVARSGRERQQRLGGDGGRKGARG